MANTNTGPEPAERTEPLPAEGHVVPLPIWEQAVVDAERIRAAAPPVPDDVEEPYQPGEDGF